MEYHTLLGDILPALHGYHLPLTWMLTDIECLDLPEVLRGIEPVIVSGRELDEVIVARPDLQIIWGVLSGFRLPHKEIDPSILPKAENSDVWEPTYKIQHPQAECELVAWDSTATFFRSHNCKIMRSFERRFPEARSLHEDHEGKSEQEEGM